MGTATTFADLIANPMSEKVFLAELKPAQWLQGWTKTPGWTNVYHKSYLNETITLADGSTEEIRKAITSIEENGAAYASKTSIADVDATTSSYWHDTASGILYAHSSTGTSPDDFTILGYFLLYFATKGIILDNRYYEPYIADNGIPMISQSSSEIHWGTSQISSGSVVLLNGRGYFDQISRSFIWHNKTAQILMGGDILPYSEYQPIYTGRIVDVRFTSQAFTVDLRSNTFDLLRTLPVNDYWASNYPNLDPSAEGKPIPIYYGSYNADQAPVVTCINTAYAANTYQFKICDTTHHPVKAIQQVYVDYGDGAGWQLIPHANQDLVNGTFTITSSFFVVGTSRVKVAFDGYHVAGILLDNAPEIVEDILTKWCGYGDGELHAASFSASKALSECPLNVPVEAALSALTIIETICKSDLAFFDEDGNGLLRYRTWEPSATGTIPVLDALDILEDETPQITDDSSKLYYRVKVGYGYRCTTQQYLYKEATTDMSRRKYNKNETLTCETYLKNPSDALLLSARLNWVTRDPSPTLNIMLKATQINKLLGDKIKVTLARAPYGSAGGYVERVFEIIGKDMSCFPVVARLAGRDLMDFGNNVGFVMGDSVPAWGAATQQEKDDSGFITDDNGYADPDDETSKNKSLIW